MSTPRDDDRIVELLRGLDPGEPPVALGPGASLRRIAARRRTRRHALGAGLAIALVGGGVVGGFVSARQDAGSTPVASGPIPQRAMPGSASAASTSSPAGASAAPGGGRIGVPPPTVTAAPTRPAGSTSPAAQSSRAQSSEPTGPAQVVLTVTGGRPGSDGASVFDVGDVMTVTISVAGGESKSVWAVRSYQSPAGGEEASLTSCSAYKAAGGRSRPALRQSWEPHLDTPGNYLVSVDVIDICGSGGTRHAEQWVSVVAPDQSSAATPAPAAAPTTAPASPSASPSISPTASPSH